MAFGIYDCQLKEMVYPETHTYQTRAEAYKGYGEAIRDRLFLSRWDDSSYKGYTENQIREEIDLYDDKDLFDLYEYEVVEV